MSRLGEVRFSIEDREGLKDYLRDEFERAKTILATRDTRRYTWEAAVHAQQTIIQTAYYYQRMEQEEQAHTRIIRKMDRTQKKQG